MEIFIFDLDNTTIDSRHRQGKGSLESWHRNMTKESIFKDELMPLSQYIRLLHNLRYKVIICTSRCLTKDDYEYLYSVVDNLFFRYNLTFLDSLYDREAWKNLLI